MFAAALRLALPSLRSLAPRPWLGARFGTPPRAGPGPLLPPAWTGWGAAVREKGCLKTNKSAAKRFVVRGKGRIKRGKAGRSHNTGHKGRKRVNRLAASAPITEKAIEERMRVLIRA